MRLHLDPAAAALLDLEGQDLTGLVRAVSDGRLFPPQVAVRDAAPLRMLCEQCRERFGVALAERFGRGAKLVDHRPEYAIRLALRGSGVPVSMDAGVHESGGGFRTANTERSVKRTPPQIRP